MNKKSYKILVAISLLGVISNFNVAYADNENNYLSINTATCSKDATIEVPATTTVIADCDGTVTIKDENTVVITHTNELTTSTYSNLDEICVEDEQKVSCGDKIGRDIDSFDYNVSVNMGIFDYNIDSYMPVTYPYEYDIADYAQQFVGNPYVWGGTSLTSGADCSGFIQTLFNTWGIEIPRTAGAQYRASTHITEDELQKGDLVFYADETGDIGHVAMYIGDGKIVHASNSAPYPQGGIKITDNYKYTTIVGYGRY